LKQSNADKKLNFKEEVMKKAFLVFCILGLAWPVQADFEFYRGVRQMGMGGASIAVVNDETAVLSNPNGLGRLRDSFLTVIDPEITGSRSGADTMVGTAIFNSVNPDDTYNELSDAVTEPYHFKGQVFPSIVFPNFGLGVLGRYEVLARRNADGSMDYNYQNDYSLNLGYNLSFWGGRIKWGFAGRLINRVESFGVRGPADSLAISSFANEGMGVSVDSGITLAAPWDYIPTLTVYVRDIGSTSFTAGSGMFGNSRNGTPRMVQQSIDVAIALFPIYSNHSRGVFTVEYTGVDSTADAEDPMDRLRIGAEVNLWDAYFLRAGWQQNDWTAGFEYATGIFQFQAATYSEQVVFPNITQQDRRAVLKFVVRF
jgi:hypothetical protein